MSKSKPHVNAHPLNPQQADFLRRYLKTGKARESAILAGYAPKSASKTANDMLRHNLTVKNEIEKHKTKGSSIASDYDLEAAMKEADEAIQIAKDDGNAAALATLIKLKAQMMKILDDKPVGAAFQIMISGIGDGGEQPRTVVTVTQPAQQLTGETDGGGSDDQV